jgi:hypothetical protein
VTRAELRAFIVNEVRTRRPDEASHAEELADHVLSQPALQSRAGVDVFLRGYFRTDIEGGQG